MPSPNKSNLKNMKMMFAVFLLAVPVLCFIGLIIYRQDDVVAYIGRYSSAKNLAIHQQGKAINISSSAIHLAAVICNNRLEDGFVMLKSAVIFSHTSLVLHVFTEEKLKQPVKDKFASWPNKKKMRLKLVIHNIEFPPTPGCLNCTTPGCQNCTPEVWKSLYSPCAAQRLFFSELLTDVDSVIYLDADTIILSPVEEAWRQFAKFGPRHSFGIAPNMENWYATHPVPHCSTGLSSGVLFMNLTRMRETTWFASIQEYFQKYRKILVLHDQDLINIYCFFNPDAVYVMDCVWNHRGEFCETDKHCDAALNTTGIKVLHGYGGKYRDVKGKPHMVQVYKAFREYNLSKHSREDLYNRIVRISKPFSRTKCGERLHVYTRHFQNYIIDNNV